MVNSCVERTARWLDSQTCARRTGISTSEKGELVGKQGADEG